MKTSIRLAALLLAAAAGAAHAAPAVDACKLATSAEVEAIAKVKVGPAAPGSPTSAQSSQCRFPHADTRAFGSSMVASVAVFKPDRIETQKRIWTQFMRTTPVPGVGDYAYYQAMGGVLFAGKGARAVQVQMLDGPSGAGRLAALKALAQIALGRL